MYNHTRLLLFAFLAPINFHSLCSPKRSALEQLTKQIIKARNTKPHKGQQELLTMLSKTKKVTTPQLATIITALEKQETFPFLIEHSSDIDTALQTFDTTPGFNHTLQTFLVNIEKPEQAKGFLYEIQKGMQLASIQNEAVQSFAQIVHAHNTPIKREFDIITNKRWVECKNVNWSSKQLDNPSSKKVCQQLLEQQKIVVEHNKFHKTKIVFELHSKQPLSEAWKQWCTENNITYLQDYQ